MPKSQPTPPSPWIVRFAPLIARGGPVLDLACGGGRHVRYLCGRGHAVVAVDVDLAGVADLAGQDGVELVAADLERSEPWPLTGRRFAGVVVANYLWRPLFPDILGAVDDGGVLIYETFAAGNEAYGKPARPEYLLRPGELLSVVGAPFRIVAYEHGYVDRPRPAVVQRLCAVRAAEPRPIHPEDPP